MAKKEPKYNEETVRNMCTIKSRMLALAAEENFDECAPHSDRRWRIMRIVCEDIIANYPCPLVIPKEYESFVAERVRKYLFEVCPNCGDHAQTHFTAWSQIFNEAMREARPKGAEWNLELCISKAQEVVELIGGGGELIPYLFEQSGFHGLTTHKTYVANLLKFRGNLPLAVLVDTKSVDPKDVNRLRRSMSVHKKQIQDVLRINEGIYVTQITVGAGAWYSNNMNNSTMRNPRIFHPECPPKLDKWMRTMADWNTGPEDLEFLTAHGIKFRKQPAKVDLGNEYGAWTVLEAYGGCRITSETPGLFPNREYLNTHEIKYVIKVPRAVPYFVRP